MVELTSSYTLNNYGESYILVQTVSVNTLEQNKGKWQLRDVIANKMIENRHLVIRDNAWDISFICTTIIVPLLYQKIKTIIWM